MTGGEACLIGSEIVSLREEHTTTDFRCSRDSSIQDFFLEQAWPHERDGFARTHVLVAGKSSSLPAVAGFYSLCNARIGCTELSKLPPRAPVQLPVVLLAQLGRHDDTLPGLVGNHLMTDMFRNVLKAADIVGTCGIVLDARNAKLVEYYKRFGFQPTKRQQLPQKMFLSIDTIREAAELIRR